MDTKTFMQLRSRGYSYYLSEIIAIAYQKAGIDACERNEMLRGKPPDTRNIYTHIIVTCVNRHRAVVMPRPRFTPRILTKNKLVKQRGELAKMTDKESKKLYRYLTGETD